MPRIAPLTEEERRNMEFRGELARAMKITRWGNEKTANALGVTVKTLIDRKNHPEKLTLREIRILRKVFPGINIT